MPSISKAELPAYVRRCWEQAQKANQRNRDAEIERLRFYVGGDLQWRDDELAKRKNANRPWVTVNKCRPAVDQIEGDIRLNPPGPQCHPVGGGADADTADIIEGLIREVEYRSGSKVAYSTAGKYSAASGYAVIELATEYTDDREFGQQLKILSVEDPSTVFFDPNSRMANRQDAGWGGKLKMYSKSEYIGAFGEYGADGKRRRILEPRGLQSAMGWIQEAMGIDGNQAQVNKWTGAGEGPYFVCEFYMVDVDRKKLRLYTDNIARYDDETIPKGVKPKVDPDNPDAYMREVPVRTITKHVVDAFEEVLKPTTWLGDLIPLFPVLGPEVYIDGVLHRLSLIAGAIDPQRALNYVATTATELGGLMPKSPWIGPSGTFADPKWQTAQSEVWAYLEYVPVFVTDENGNQSLAPAPQRNQWEAPIQWLLALGAYFSDAIKAVTGIYDPSLGATKNDQSGKAIEQLRSESNVGNFSYADNLHRAIEVMYDQMCCIFPKILDGPRVVTIVKPDSQHEVAEINRVFPDGGIDPATGKPGKTNNICMGRYAVRVTAGKNFQTRQEEAIVQLTDFFGNAPQTLAVPGVAAKYLRMIGDGNPQVEGMADLLAPQGEGGEATPQQLQEQLQNAGQQIQAMKAVIQKMQQVISAKLPEIQSKKFIAALDNLTKIRVAEISASKDADNADANREADTLESILRMAHESATQAVEHENQQNTLDKTQAGQIDQQTREHAHAGEMAEMTAEQKAAEAAAGGGKE